MGRIVDLSWGMLQHFSVSWKACRDRAMRSISGRACYRAGLTKQQAFTWENTAETAACAELTGDFQLCLVGVEDMFHDG